jgi:hypothetical protein
MGVVDAYSSINSDALRSATCRRCERASRCPVLLVRQCPYMRGARYTGACPDRPYLRIGICNYVELIDTIFTDVEGVD